MSGYKRNSQQQSLYLVKVFQFLTFCQFLCHFLYVCSKVISCLPTDAKWLENLAQSPCSAEIFDKAHPCSQLVLISNIKYNCRKRACSWRFCHQQCESTASSRCCKHCHKARLRHLVRTERQCWSSASGADASFSDHGVSMDQQCMGFFLGGGSMWGGQGRWEQAGKGWPQEGDGTGGSTYCRIPSPPCWARKPDACCFSLHMQNSRQRLDQPHCRTSFYREKGTNSPKETPEAPDNQTARNFRTGIAVNKYIEKDNSKIHN